MRNDQILYTLAASATNQSTFAWILPSVLPVRDIISSNFTFGSRGAMSDYTFDALNDKDLENLVRDLLQAELGIYFESFKSGKDGGVDLRHSKANSAGSEIIVQVKHWHLSGLKPLLRHLEKKESKKVKKLNPDRYLLATSVRLSLKNKRDIASFLHPHVKDTSDIYGKDDLNNLLQKHGDIEVNHFKLWISSTATLQRILNNAVSSRSAFVRAEIIRKASLFVPTNNFGHAIDKLNKHHILLIKGVPGVGKTTLADFLIYRLLADGFKLVVVDEDLRDAEDNYHPSDRQVFFFDDFLGSNYLQLVHSKGSGAGISRFVERVSRDKNKRLILTTRTTILNRAYHQLHQLGEHALRRSDIELHLDDYSRLDRARILYNHMYFRHLPPEYSSTLFENEKYFEVIDHDNYNPRIIEFITDPARLENIAPEAYLKFIERNLDRPDAIWESAYDNQIDDDARFALDTLFSLGDGAKSTELQAAFDERLDYEVKNNGFRRNTNAFHNAMRLLLDGFVIHQRSSASDGYYSFINPSVVDFLISRFSRDPSEKWRVLESVRYFSQLDTRFGTSKDHPIQIDNMEKDRFLSLLSSRALRRIGKDSDRVKLLFIRLLMKSFGWKKVVETCRKLLEDVSLASMSNSYLNDAHAVMKGMIGNAEATHLLRNRSDEIIPGLLSASNTPEEVAEAKTLFDDLELNYVAWLEQSDNQQFAQDTINAMWNYGHDSYVLDDERVQQMLEDYEAETVIEQLLSEAREINTALGLDDSPAFEEISNFDAYDVLSQNQEAASAEDYIADSGREDNYLNGTNETELIRDLFSR